MRIMKVLSCRYYTPCRGAGHVHIRSFPLLMRRWEGGEKRSQFTVMPRMGNRVT